MDDHPRYMISVAADLVGMHPQTLRIYEQKGLVRPKRTAGNTRLYSELDVGPREQLEAKIKQVRGGRRVTSRDPEETYQALEKFGRDLTAAAESGKLDPGIGRAEDIRRGT